MLTFNKLYEGGQFAFENETIDLSKIPSHNVYKNCTFTRVIFKGTSTFLTWRDCKFIECDFSPDTGFTNSIFNNVEFRTCALSPRLAAVEFFDCVFDKSKISFYVSAESYLFNSDIFKAQEIFVEGARLYVGEHKARVGLGVKDRGYTLDDCEEAPQAREVF